MSNARQIAALLEERRGYVARRLADRVAAVDTALAALNYAVTETATIEPQPETATRKKPTRRTKG
jgi:hypothetical protein